MAVVTAFLVLSIVVAALAVLITRWLQCFARPVPWTPTAPRMQLADGRQLAYATTGSSSKSARMLIWFHGSTLSRLDVKFMDKAALEDLNLKAVVPDRPGYGQSSPHGAATWQSTAADTAALMDHLGAQKFLVGCTSSGGRFGLAAAKYLPERVAGLLMLGPAGPLPGNLTREELAHHNSFTRPSMLELIRSLDTPMKQRIILATGSGEVGGRFWYHLARMDELIADPLGKFLPDLSPPDRECIVGLLRPQGQGGIMDMVREGFLTKNFQAFLEDHVNNWGPTWPGSIAELSPEMQRTMHIYHGTQDNTVPIGLSKSFKRLAPHIHLHVVEGAAHFSLWYDNPVTGMKQQREMLTAVLETARW